MILDPPDAPNVWQCCCLMCSAQWTEPFEPDLDEETGHVVYHKPQAICPDCGSAETEAEESF